MTEVYETLARKYAQAFLNCFVTQIDQDGFDSLCELESFFRMNKKVIYFLSLASIDMQTKEKFMHKFFKQFGVEQWCDQLVHTLLINKRGQLLYLVLKQIIILYRVYHNIALFHIVSSHALSEEDIAIVQQFLAQVSSCDIIYEYTVDKRLIAGIRLQSDTLLWEYSIDKQLGLISHKSIH